METKKRRAGGCDLLLLVLSVVELVGIRTVFRPCGPKEDGSWMSCHWAGQAVTGIAVCLVILSIAHLLTGNRGMKLGLDVGVMVLTVFSVLIPGRLIGLCMMPDMRCHQLMTPGVTVCSVLVLAAAVADAALIGRKGKRHEV